MTSKVSNKSSPSDWANLTEDEVLAAIESKLMAGEYIESIGKTDFADFTREEFETMCLVICNDFRKNVIPF